MMALSAKSRAWSITLFIDIGSDMVRSVLEEALRFVGEFHVHPLGFVYHRKAIGGKSYRRIHVWTPSLSVARAHATVHSHPYDIRSCIVAGKLENRLYSFSEENDGNVFEFRGSYHGSTSSLTPTGRKGELAEVVSFCCSPTDGAYRLSGGVIYEARPKSLPCITVVATNGAGGESRSYGPADSVEDFDRRPLTAGEGEEVKEALIATLRE